MRKFWLCGAIVTAIVVPPDPCRAQPDCSCDMMPTTPHLGESCDYPCGPGWMTPEDRALIPQGWHGADFRPACRRHDECYQTGVRRVHCDLQFYRELRAECRNNSLDPVTCRQIAAQMYVATRRYGGQLTAWQRDRLVRDLRYRNAVLRAQMQRRGW